MRPKGPPPPSRLSLDGVLPTNTPLGRLLHVRRAERDFSRLRRLGILFEHFHLKYTSTSKVEGRRVELNGRPVVNFGSANYLGLEQHPEVIRASQRAMEELGTHSGCSRVFSSHDNILDLEAEISELVGAEATLVGANVSQVHAGVIPALFGRPDSVLFLDRHAHTSIYEASQIAKAKGARVVRVDISSPVALRERIRRERPGRGALLVDGVYSMQGHIPDLVELDAVCRAAGIILYVDDAHGIGAFGKSGGGVREACELSFDNLLLVGSLQKGLGAFGAFVSGKDPVIQYLRVTSKSYIFSGTLQPAAVEGARAAIRISRAEEGAALRRRLSRLSRKVRRSLTEMGYAVPAGDSPIVPVLIGPDMLTLMAGRKLFDLGIYLNSVLYPAVSRGRGILRVSLTSLHSDDDIAALLGAFGGLREYLDAHRSPVRRTAHIALEVVKSKWLGKQYAGL